MDTRINKKNKNGKYIILALFVIGILAAFFVYYARQKNSINVQREDIRIAKVKQSKFEDMMMITAKTESLNSSLVNVPEGGAVKEIYAEDGDVVKKNQPIARVYNPNTEFNYLNQETSIMQQISQMRNSLLEIQNQEFATNKELLQADNDYNTALDAYNLQERLFKAEIGRKTDFEQAEQNLAYRKDRKQLIEAGIAQEKQTRLQQTKSIKNSISQMEKSLSKLRSNKNNFIILAPVTGRLSSFDISLGQNLVSGESIGKIDLLDGYKLLAKVDEYYINRLQTGVMGSLDFNNKVYDVIVTKVLPEVKGGQFDLELTFAHNKPTDLRMGMTFGIKLKLSKDTESLVIPKGNFYKDTGGNWVYVINGSTAEKHHIELGRENTLQYEVLSGLTAGQEIITSSYEDFKKYDFLHIK